MKVVLTVLGILFFIIAGANWQIKTSTNTTTAIQWHWFGVACWGAALLLPL